MRFALIATVFAAALLAGQDTASAQGRGQGGGGQQQDRAADKKKREQEWQLRQGPLTRNRNAGPCPYVKVLYDAARYVEFAEQREASGSVAWTGEIQGVEADCRYRGDDPIQVDVNLLFSFGKGPRAEGDTKTYRYWVAVTERNRTVLAKEWFDIQADFEGGDRADYRERLGGITIPRASGTVSGTAFEVLVGFEVTPAMAAFNREGKRFRVDAGAPAAEPATQR
ncbi:MAG TPA: Tat pathway signal sequence domain protein [Caulobacteraceae bacterium]|jgi:hypothetical protein